MNVDRNEKVWAWTSSGSKIHAFVEMSEGTPHYKRALCRKNILRDADSIWFGQMDTGYPSSICTSCLIKAEDMWDRAEDSMSPATEADDLGYVAPVADIDALHAEALEMDELETVKAELVGQKFSPTTVNLVWHTDSVAVVTDVTVRPHDRGFTVHLKIVSGGAYRVPYQYTLLVFRAAWRPVEEATPARWHYRAHRTTITGDVLGVVEGYLPGGATVPDKEAVMHQVRKLYNLPGYRIRNFEITPA